MPSALGSYPAAADYAAVLPAFVVATVPLLLLFVDLFFRGKGVARRTVAVVIAVAGLAAAGIIEAHQYPHDYPAFAGAFVQGGFSIVFSDSSGWSRWGKMAKSTNPNARSSPHGAFQPTKSAPMRGVITMLPALIPIQIVSGIEGSSSVSPHSRIQ